MAQEKVNFGASFQKFAYSPRSPMDATRRLQYNSEERDRSNHNWRYSFHLFDLINDLSLVDLPLHGYMI